MFKNLILSISLQEISNKLFILELKAFLLKINHEKSIFSSIILGIISISISRLSSKILSILVSFISSSFVTVSNH
jgi:hypothetical protein